MNTEETWDITTSRYVAYIDIMGFKDMVARTPHNEVYEMMKRIDKRRKHVESVDWVKTKTKAKLVKSTTYSDSIILYSKDDSYESFDFLVSTVAGLTNYLFVEGVPHKGALAFGTMTLDTDNSIFFGQPLIDAYLLQEEIHFYGVLFHSTVEQEIANKKFENPLFTKKYLCNLKGGLANHLTVYPLFASQKNNANNRDKYIELFKSVNLLRLKTSGSLRKYIDNTEIYLNAINS